MISHTIVRNAPQQDLINDLRFFIRGANKIEKCNPVDLTKVALTLLKTLPASRNAVFEYFCNVFGQAAANYIEGIEVEINTGKLPPQSEIDEVIVSEIHLFLSGLIAENATAWAPIISTFSLELLGKVSTNYAGRAHISSNLNETLQLWMNCRATRTLVDINTKCLSSLIHSDTEACISALLDTSVQHSPHFDWVVAHVGSCFPTTVITRVLSCGLKDFCQNKSYDHGGSDSAKLKSVVGILGHLAASHSTDIRKAIVDMFIWSLHQTFDDSDLERLQKKATVPFILQLCHLSLTLLSSVCSDTKHTLSVDIMVRLYHFVSDWCKYFGTQDALEDLVITLILKCETGGIQIINLLLDCILVQKIKGIDNIKFTIQDKAKEILQTILKNVDESVRHKNSCEIVVSFTKEVNEVNKLLLNENQIVAETGARIVTFLGHINPLILVHSASYLLQNAQTAEQLSILLKLLTSELIDPTCSPYSDSGGHFGVVVEQVLNRNIQRYAASNEENSDLTQMWMNLLTLLRWEKSEEIPLLNSKLVSRAIECNFVNLTSLFASETLHVHLIADILNEMETATTFNNPPSIQSLLNLTQSTVNYFFACCKDDGTSRKLKGFTKVYRILKRLCIYSKVCKVLALRELLERALFRSDNVLFGAKNNSNDDTSEKILLKQNKKISKTIPLTKHSSVFNGGIIGTGKRKSISSDELPPDVIANNTYELISAIKACCALPADVDTKYTDLSLDSMTLVSLLLVQFVSPDVMYNGLPWPEEEFSKVTIERDLFIRRLFSSTPLLWDLLGFVAIYRPAICYCSVLIRALTATLIHQWKSMGEQSKSNETENYKGLMSTTIKVIDIMALSQLLPHPLSCVRDILPYLKCYEIVAILRDCIWCYMRDHIPSPALFGCDSNGIYWRDPSVVRPSEMYTNALRIIMQRNIKSLGHMYAQMFINVPKHD